MQIFPQDLGIRRHLALVRKRSTQAIYGGGQYGQMAAPPPVSVSDPAPAPRLGFLGRLWARGSGLTHAQAAAALPAVGDSTLGLFWGFAGTGGCLAALSVLIGAVTGKAEPALILGGLSAALALPGLLSPGPFFRSLHKKPLTVAEIETLLAAVPDEHKLERAYLNLALTALHQRANASADAEQDVRDALRALGEAIDNLPFGAFSDANVSVSLLRDDARETLLRAQNETDHVIAASLRRRAEALEQAADATDRSALLIRRGVALRDELLAQTEALRLGLTSFNNANSDAAGMGGASSAQVASGSLSRLAESVRDVAREARSIASAREELDGVVTTTPAVAENTSPPILQSVGSGSGSNARL